MQGIGLQVISTLYTPSPQVSTKQCHDNKTIPIYQHILAFQNKLSSAKFLVCYEFQSASSMLLKIVEKYCLSVKQPRSV